MSEFLQFGIDLGTTNSCISHVRDGEAIVLQNNDLMNVTPSAVRVLKTGSIIVGRRATNAIVNDPENVAIEFKRLMGQRYTKTFPASNRTSTSEELSAEVLKSMLADAERLTGKAVLSAVITVPSAFTALQCEATARAAQMAGLEEYHLLQEPIAAAVAYGAKFDKEGKRWLVFDLGGGTLDVAVVSTANNRLNVIEHRGDNHLGGKDIDRLIVEKILLPHLKESYALPEANLGESSFNKLYRKLISIAEFAKIELSSQDSTTVSIYDVGEDFSGNTIESDLAIDSEQVNGLAEPIYARSVELVNEALREARLKTPEVDRILLVGGPTQNSYLRNLLEKRLGIQVDHSLDPMTVVARGAALFASTIESKISKSVIETSSQAVAVQLAYDTVTNSPEVIVAGKVIDENHSPKEVKLESESGVWTSGWHPLEDNFFEINALLQENATNRLQLSFRDERGKELPGNPSRITIRQGVLMISAPPLPHTISIEVADSEGSRLIPVFERMSLLPIEKDVSFRGSHTLRPSEPGTLLAIKLWEGEALTDPEANQLIGIMQIASESVRRPIPEGSEIRLHINIDTSRLITVEAFVPHLNQHFAEKIYMPKEGELDYVEQIEKLPAEMGRLRGRLAKLEEFLFYHSSSQIAELEGEFPPVIYDEEDEEFPSIIYNYTDFTAELSPDYQMAIDESAHKEIDKLLREIENLDIEIITAKNETTIDEDLARGFVDRAKKIRAEIAELEKRLDHLKQYHQSSLFLSEARELVADVFNYGTEAQKDKCSLLYSELKKNIAKDEKLIVQKQIQAMKKLRGEVLHAQEWFWTDWFDYLSGTEPEFKDKNEARKWIDQGKLAFQKDNLKNLKTAVQNLWRLEVKTLDETDLQDLRSIRPGLKK